MTRRNFLALITGSLGSLLLGKKSTAPAGPRQAVPLCLCPVAGFQYYMRPSLVRKIRPGQALVIRREPDNPYDQLAVAVYTENGAKLGYMPRTINEIPANLMDSGRTVTAIATRIDRKAPPWQAMDMELRLIPSAGS